MLLFTLKAIFFNYFVLFAQNVFELESNINFNANNNSTPNNLDSDLNKIIKS